MLGKGVGIIEKKIHLDSCEPRPNVFSGPWTRFMDWT